MPKCQIQWIDERGVPTPDDNEAIGEAKCHDPATFGKAGSKSYPICAEHAKRMEKLPHWRLAELGTSEHKEAAFQAAYDRAVRLHLRRPRRGEQL